MRLRVVIVPTGTANIASVRSAFARLDVDTVVTDEGCDVEGAAAVVIPGVGTFGAAMDRVSDRGLGRVLTERIGVGGATLAICVGFQLLARASAESPDARGLGVIDGALNRFQPPAKTPQLGWNRVTADDGARILSSGWAYFANSYRLERVPVGWTGATASHGEPFVAAVERGAVVGCQFHPELSGSFGEGVLGAWIDRAKEVA